MHYNIETFCDNDLNANTYLIYNNEKCIVIDPANNLRTLFKYIGERKILGVFLTHGHYDHFKSLKELLSETDSLVYMHKNAYPKLKDPKSSYAGMFGFPYPTIIEEDKVRFVKDGEKIELEGFTIKCWYTPGHTDCMMSYFLDDNLFSGDFIFKGSIGRTDLETSDKIRMCNMIKEIRNRKVNYTIYPGHDLPTTLEDEKRENVYFDDNNIRLI